MAAISKSERYDRQLRMWGAAGQEALESAHVCLIGSQAVGTELLKNLVLPGIGAFTILDDAKVSAADSGTNFFIHTADVGKNRAEVTSRYLSELNPNVAADYDQRSPSSVVSEDAACFLQFSIVIVANHALSLSELLALDRVLFPAGIPLVIARANGFIGLLQLVNPQHFVIEAKPDFPVFQLRISEPWPELEAIANSLQPETMTSQQFSHVPYILLLLRCLKLWRSETDGTAERVPTTKEEKARFQALLAEFNLFGRGGGGVADAEDCAGGENRPQDGNSAEVLGDTAGSAARIMLYENLEAATKNAYRAWAEPSLPYQFDGLRESVHAEFPRAIEQYRKRDCKRTRDALVFWTIARALAEFVTEQGSGVHLPLPGNIPDMTADTQSYLALQKLYHTKAEEDSAWVYARVQEHLAAADIDAATVVTEEVVKRHCRNAYFLDVLRTPSLSDEHSSEVTPSEELLDSIKNEGGDALFYVLFRASERFADRYGRQPGAVDMEADIPLLQEQVSCLLTDMNLPTHLVSEDLIHEMCRYGGAELHSVAAFVGGLGSQEVVKLLTHQYTPINSVLLYNGMTNSSVVVQP
eukprot:CAMPEP_0174235246 /NCGR_PEP_ID=MMETSP0417-20130205/4762_1 /TAXON_ID=242541 /ORGANISM="Mayorella sp, Strain BSH-02190019" /LENGTH=583 /DNA_ID=CAMNT_0015313731 /DNA_START=15 /DNA_END=1766 /DNA_ORIENTATION=+